MTEYYFARFPQIEYGEDKRKAVNITKVPAIANNVKGQITLFYPYEIQSNMRPDVLAASYYSDSYLEWLVFLANGILDPYCDWYMSDDDFNALLVKTYGSIEETQRRVKHYAINWPDDSVSITVEHFTNILPEALKKYYTPRFGNGSKILGYERAKEEWIINTNQIIRLEVDLASNTEFVNNEIVIFKTGGQTVGNGEIIVANSSVVKIQHITGNTSANNELIGLTSNAHANVTNSDVVLQVIPEEEFIYWQPVVIFDYERNKNERNKNIYLIDNRLTIQIADEFRKALAANG